MRNFINELLKSCKATPCTEPVEGGKFYKIMSQSFKLPNGKIITREFIKKRPAATVVPVTDKGNIVCVIQPVSLSKEGSLIEVPSGYGESRETIDETAVRELVEETGYIPKEVICLGSHYQDPGSIKETVTAFIALGCERLQEQKLDKDEYIKTVEIPVTEIKKMMEENEIKDANTYIALAKAILANFI